MSRGRSSAQVMFGGELWLQPGSSYSADCVRFWSCGCVSVLLEDWLERDQSGQVIDSPSSLQCVISGGRSIQSLWLSKSTSPTMQKYYESHIFKIVLHYHEQNGGYLLVASLFI